MRGLIKPNVRPKINALSGAQPYQGLGVAGDSGNDCSDAVFVTGRFRSGSTLLWNIFRQLDTATAFYEPFNERRWFDEGSRGDRVDNTHLGVSDYWREYNGLEKLAPLYDDDWTSRNLYMDSDFWAPRMQQYIECLIRHAKGRALLQFNRIDFRLPWIRHHFPQCPILHIYRHPSDQWCSTLKDIKRFPADAGGFQEFRRFDGFYLMRWVKDLRFHFPFLSDEDNEHPYRCFYYLWKLSYLFGRQYAQHSICFEQLIEKPQAVLEPILNALQFEVRDWSEIESVIEKPNVGRWEQYESDAWFLRHESHCENVLRDYFA